MVMSDNAIIPVEQLAQLAASNQATAEELSGMVQQMGVYLLQLDARLRKQEELLTKKITINNNQYNRILLAVRSRANVLLEKYSLTEPCKPSLRTAMKKELLRRYQIKNLHDLPESALGEALAAVAMWDSYSLVRQMRETISIWGGNEHV